MKRILLLSLLILNGIQLYTMKIDPSKFKNKKKPKKKVQ